MDGFFQSFGSALSVVSVVALALAGGWKICKYIVRVEIRFGTVKYCLRALDQMNKSLRKNVGSLHKQAKQYHVSTYELQNKVASLGEQVNRNRETICELGNMLQELQMRPDELEAAKAKTNFGLKDIRVALLSRGVSKSRTRANLKEVELTAQSVLDILALLQKDLASCPPELLDKIVKTELFEPFVRLAVYDALEQNKSRQHAKSSDVPLSALDTNRTTPYNAQGANHSLVSTKDNLAHSFIFTVLSQFFTANLLSIHCLHIRALYSNVANKGFSSWSSVLNVAFIKRLIITCSRLR